MFVWSQTLSPRLELLHYAVSDLPVGKRGSAGWAKILEDQTTPSLSERHYERFFGEKHSSFISLPRSGFVQLRIISRIRDASTDLVVLSGSAFTA
jgi:hypothetical protein